MSGTNSNTTVHQILNMTPIPDNQSVNFVIVFNNETRYISLIYFVVYQNIFNNLKSLVEDIKLSIFTIFKLQLF